MKPYRIFTTKPKPTYHIIRGRFGGCRYVVIKYCINKSCRRPHRSRK